MSVTRLDPGTPCVYCGAAWQPVKNGNAHTCTPPAARHVTLAESLEAHLARETDVAARKRRTARIRRQKIAAVFGPGAGAPVKGAA
jgi:hypothetical protein